MVFFFSFFDGLSPFWSRKVLGWFASCLLLSPPLCSLSFCHFHVFAHEKRIRVITSEPTFHFLFPASYNWCTLYFWYSKINKWEMLKKKETVGDAVGGLILDLVLVHLPSFFFFLSRFLFDVEILIDCMLLLTYLSLCCFIFYPK